MGAESIAETGSNRRRGCRLADIERRLSHSEVPDCQVVLSDPEVASSIGEHPYGEQAG
jgi:hypothetical protein